MRDRLREHFGLNDNESGFVYDDVASQRGAGADMLSRSMFTLRIYIEDSLTLFSGTDSIEIRHWIEEFEDNTDAVGWNELQRFIYAKQLLKGAARMFVRSLSGVNSWNLLKI